VYTGLLKLEEEMEKYSISWRLVFHGLGKKSSASLPSTCFVLGKHMKLSAPPVTWSFLVKEAAKMLPGDNRKCNKYNM